MNLLSKISAVLRKNGYQKEYNEFDLKIFLKWIDTRYAFGFTIAKLPKRKYPEIGVGILDKELGLIQNELEGTQDLGFYHLSMGKGFFDQNLIEQEHTPQIINEVVKIVEKQIKEFEEMQQTIIDDFRRHLNQLAVYPYFHEYIPNLKCFGHIYQGLLFRLIEKGTLTTNDMTEAIKLAEEKQVDNKMLKHKLGLIDNYLTKKSKTKGL